MAFRFTKIGIILFYLFLKKPLLLKGFYVFVHILNTYLYKFSRALEVKLPDIFSFDK